MDRAVVSPQRDAELSSIYCVRENERSSKAPTTCILASRLHPRSHLFTPGAEPSPASGRRARARTCVRAHVSQALRHPWGQEVRGSAGQHIYLVRPERGGSHPHFTDEETDARAPERSDCSGAFSSGERRRGLADTGVTTGQHMLPLWLKGTRGIRQRDGANMVSTSEAAERRG